MAFISGLLSTIGIFILAIFILVLIHELGHFLFAKWFGMRVERFSIGFPPRLFGKQIGDTDYCISALPVGGYVKISGVMDETMDTEFLNEEPKPWEFRSKPVWQRILVMAGGVLFNVILTVVIFTGINMNYGEARIPMKSIHGFFIEENTLPHKLGFRTGDTIIKVNGESISHMQELYKPSFITSDNLTFTVIRNGEARDIVAPPDFVDLLNKEPQFISIMNALPGITSGTVSGSPADKAGLKAGDKILRANEKPIVFWLELVHLIREEAGKPIQLEVERAGENLLFTLTPDPESKTIGLYPINELSYFDIEVVKFGFFAALVNGYQKTIDMGVGILQGLGKMISGAISVKDNLGGPVAIANVTKQATEMGGWRGFWEITAMLSVTLAIMNLLPIPMLDGGHIVFLLYEAVTRREPSHKVRMALQQAGFILLVGVLIFVTFNDIMRQF